MKSTRTGTTLNISLEGAIGESTPMFTLPLDGTKEMILDLGRVTYINSIGVRQWIVWTLKIPKDCKVKMTNCPFVFGSQASTVVGFLSPNMTIESLRLPFACENCSYEESYLATRGKDFEYAVAGNPPMIATPEQKDCPKCKEKQLEPDFFKEKTFKFLRLDG